ncbi:sensor histidine kinase [Nakamurella deserti]|uniref:sensor histidine kinase n=1 Tax=Nakamurella deserti TaxID=2164074 RepID=UPI000DBE4D7D|nr:HAMP domain-containing sensor histidine kinase [Nakamurella deserti]
MSFPAGEAPLPPRPRWSLRARLIGLVLLVTTLALVVVDIVLPTLVRGALNTTRDQSLNVVVTALPGRIGPDNLERLTATSTLRGGIGWSLVYPDGKVKSLVGPADDDPGPLLAGDLGTQLRTVGGLQTGDHYRILPTQVAADGETATLVAWTNVEDDAELLERLIVTELVISAGLLLLLGSAASLLIRRELKPLEQMADTADSIAAGDLSRRVAVGESGVEVDRLGVAFNGMLDGINTLLAEREAAEHRLRQFVADASHELRTPVAAVRGYSDLYAAGALPEAPAVARAMERMGFEARRMGSLVEDLLTLAQADAPDSLVADRVELTDLLAGAVEDAAAIDPSRQWVMVPRPDDLPPIVVFGDHNRLHQLFANLLGNIRTHTEPGTTATVSVEPDPDPRFVVVTVADDGRGVDAAALPFLFDRFYRADPSRSREHGGSGLGLAIVAAIATAHGGAVSATRAAAGGLAVRVRLPQARPGDGRPATVATA